MCIGVCDEAYSVVGWVGTMEDGRWSRQSGRGGRRVCRQRELNMSCLPLHTTVRSVTTQRSVLPLRRGQVCLCGEVALITSLVLLIITETV